MEPTPGTRPRSTDAPRLVRFVGLLATTAVLVGGCDLRLETPPPPSPVPDALETIRERTAEDATTLAELAQQAAARTADPVAAVLDQIAEASSAHAAAVGGPYEPFPGATPPPTPSPTLAPGPPARASAAEVLARLTAAATTARTDATAADGPTARLLASVAVNRRLLADALRVTMGGTAARVEDPADPTTLPAGVTVTDAVVLVQSEDAAGMVWEVAAARSADDVRQRAADRATVHRDRAQAWAEAAGIAGTVDDPRRSAYDLPDAVTADPAGPGLWNAVGEVEAGLAASYASLVATADPAARDALVDALADGTRAQVALGAAVPAFPGLPEQA